MGMNIVSTNGFMAIYNGITAAILRQVKKKSLVLFHINN